MPTWTSRSRRSRSSTSAAARRQFQAQLKQQGFTLPLLKIYQRGNLLSDKLYKKITADAKVTDAGIQKYYNENKTQYTKVGEPRRAAHPREQQGEGRRSRGPAQGRRRLRALAKKYSKDTLSAVKGGKLTIEKGKTVAEFDKAAFALKTNAISPPVHTQYGWHIIQALSAVKPASTQPLAAVKETIRQNLLARRRPTSSRSGSTA